MYTKLLRYPEVYLAAEKLVDAYGKSQSFIKDKQDWLRSARKLIASLWLHQDDLFRFTTKTKYFSGKTKLQPWYTVKTLKLFRTLLELGWVTLEIKHIAPKYAHKDTGLSTVYRRTETFKDLLLTVTKEAVTADTDLPRIEFRNTNGSVVKTIKSDKVLEEHYELLLNSNIQGLNSSDYYYIRKFKVNSEQFLEGSMGIGKHISGGRFYAPFCNLPKQERLSITINDEPVASMDYSQLHPTLLLLRHYGVSEEPKALDIGGDVYTMIGYPELPREAHKTFINTIINADSIDAAARSIATATQYWDIFEDKPVFKTYKGKEKRIGEPVWAREPLKSAYEYIKHFFQQHPLFKPLSGKGAWRELQFMDSHIMHEVIRVTTEAGVPVLPVHDEVIVQESNKFFIERLMARALESIFTEDRKPEQVMMSWESEKKEKGLVVLVS